MLDFLKKKCQKQMPTPNCLERETGFPKTKTEKLLKNLVEVLPNNRKKFWEDLPDILVV